MNVCYGGSTRSFATFHVTIDSLAALHYLYPERVASHESTNSARWDYLKGKVFNPLPVNLNVLKQRIIDRVNDIPRAML